jgi:large subunit ribosomal protein L21
MYAVIATGGKQARVEEGQRVEVERLGPVDTTVELTPVLLVDGDTVLATPEQLAGAKVTAKVVDEHRTPKITGFTYQAKARRRRRWGHRQTMATIEITGISRG